MAVVIHHFADHSVEPDKFVSQAWFAIASVVGFLIVFRTQQGYSRYWEGASLLQSVKAYWLNASSNLVAFCTKDPARQQDVERFQHVLVRLVSLLHCSALQTVAMMHDNDFEVIELSGLSKEYIDHVNSHEHNKCFVVLQSVQQLVVEHIRNGVVDIPPPIASRVFQELSNGIVALTNVRKITDVPFPFPYAQLVTVMLLISTSLTPFVTGLLFSDAHWAAMLTFIFQFAFWSINYIAAEIEMPFGDDTNDLPIHELQREMNECLTNLLHPLIECAPSFKYHADHHKTLKIIRCTTAMTGDRALLKRSDGTSLKAGAKRKCVYDQDKSKASKLLSRLSVASLVDALAPDTPSNQSTKYGGLRPGRASKDIPDGEDDDDSIIPQRTPETMLRMPRSEMVGKECTVDIDSPQELSRPEAFGDRAGLAKVESSAMPFSGLSSAGVLVSITEDKESKFSSSSSSWKAVLKEDDYVVPGMEMKSLSRPHKDSDEMGICQQLYLQSQRNEALLERLADEVERIRLDGTQLSNGLLGSLGNPTPQRNPPAPESLRNPLALSESARRKPGKEAL